MAEIHLPNSPDSNNKSSREMLLQSPFLVGRQLSRMNGGERLRAGVAYNQYAITGVSLYFKESICGHRLGSCPRAASSFVDVNDQFRIQSGEPQLAAAISCCRDLPGREESDLMSISTKWTPSRAASFLAVEMLESMSNCFWVSVTITIKQSKEFISTRGPSR
jgi:hypothetical protein